MKNKKPKKIAALTVTAGIVFASVIPAFAGTWQKDTVGWRYQENEGSCSTGKWVKDNGSWYHFDDSGYMQTGWVMDESTWYYLNEDGAMATGWLFDNGFWYYLNQAGVMETGWRWIGDNWYYFDDNGSMATGWIWDGNSWYFMNADGSLGDTEVHSSDRQPTGAALVESIKTVSARLDTGKQEENISKGSNHETAEPAAQKAVQEVPESSQSTQKAVQDTPVSNQSARNTRYNHTPQKAEDTADKSVSVSNQTEKAQNSQIAGTKEKEQKIEIPVYDNETSAEKELQNVPAETSVPEQEHQTAAHEHTWEPVYQTIHHDAVTHEEPVYEEVWHEERWEQGDFLWYEPLIVYVTHCNSCGQEFENHADFDKHLMGQGGSCPGGYLATYHVYDDTSKPVYDEVYVPGYYENIITGYETVVDSTAWDEQIITGYTCSECGAIQ